MKPGPITSDQAALLESVLVDLQIRLKNESRDEKAAQSIFFNGSCAIKVCRSIIGERLSQEINETASERLRQSVSRHIKEMLRPAEKATPPVTLEKQIELVQYIRAIFDLARTDDPAMLAAPNNPQEIEKYC